MAGRKEGRSEGISFFVAPRGAARDVAGASQLLTSAAAATGNALPGTRATVLARSTQVALIVSPNGPGADTILENVLPGSGQGCGRGTGSAAREDPTGRGVLFCALRTVGRLRGRRWGGSFRGVHGWDVSAQGAAGVGEDSAAGTVAASPFDVGDMRLIKYP